MKVISSSLLSLLHYMRHRFATFFTRCVCLKHEEAEMRLETHSSKFKFMEFDFFRFSWKVRFKSETDENKKDVDLS